MPLGIDFWKDFGGFWMPKCSKVDPKVESKIDVNFERRFFKTVYCSRKKNQVSQIQHVQVGSKKTIKHQSKNKAQNTMHLGIDF